MRRGGRGDDDVGERELLGQAVEAHDLTAEAFGERARAVGVAVGDEDRAGALARECLRGELARLAGAEDDHVAVAERAEQRGREVDGDGGQAHAAGADRGLRAHELAGRERGREEAVDERARDPRGERRLVRAPHLSLDLGLAEHHRLEARGHAEELARGVAVARRVDRARRARSAGSRRAVRAARAARTRPSRGRRRPGRSRCGCTSRSRRPRRRRGRRRRLISCRPNSIACASVNASRSRSATGAVLCETPSASSSFIRARTPPVDRGLAAGRADRAAGATPRSRSGAAAARRSARAARRARARCGSGASP